MSVKKYYVRVDKKGRIINGSMVQRVHKPIIGVWKEIEISTTTSTTTTTTTTIP